MALMGVVFSAVAANTTDRPLPMTAFAALALSAFVVAWWCARFWHAALRETPEPKPWPWLLPPLTLIVIFIVAGVGALQDGEKGSGIGMLVTAGLLLLPFAVGLAVGLVALLQHRSRRRQNPAAPRTTSEPQRPHRAWGTID
ncbi:hypothetical protein FM076_00880 [Streptomyces albus subsp. chlorinus]|uniref:hypothetical protein n=1 Tax=Streptomyces albus TaxID=1888 RepID=UPI00156D79D7|nr:hypothetical protein [Streptomyces albus]NSC19844.1 hypothetical protein [Streptomyces albus subsp. chlorinus]